MARYPTQFFSPPVVNPLDYTRSEVINDIQDEVKAMQAAMSLNMGAWRTWNPTVSGWGSNSKTGVYCQVGLITFFTLTLSGTANSTTKRLTLPVNSAHNGIASYGAMLIVGTTAPGMWKIDPNTGYIYLYANFAQGTLPTTGTVAIQVQGFYPTYQATTG